MSTMVSSSPVASPSPTPPLNQLVSSSPHHNSQSLSTKAGAILASAKSTLSEQSSRLALKHNTDLDLLDDLRMYLKNRCSVERDYSQAMIKLNQTYSKKSSSLLNYAVSEDEVSEVKTVYTSWRIYQDEMEKHAKYRLNQFEQLSTICEQLKLLRNHKVQVTKKCLDTHLKKMQDEILNSVSEIDKTRKLYFEEEHLAKQARDKEEKIKKRKTGIFSSFSSLQNRKERTSAHREASDIQSTQARNEYILALAAGNAHLLHYHEQDLSNLMISIDDCVLDKCRGFILNLLQVEQDTISSWNDVAQSCFNLMQATSADYTNSVFLKDPNSASIIETLLYEFQPCDNDPLDTVSLEHNADIALRNEGQKWFQWFSKECRNLNRLSAQLIKLQALQSEGHKSVDIAGSGSVDLESRIDELRHQLRKSEISKMKAKARLQIIRDSGAEVEDFEGFEVQVASEIKQQSLDVDLNIGDLSRTSSVRSNIGFSDVKSPTFNKFESDNVQSSHNRPESSSSVEQLDSPDREVLQMGSSIECTSPAPTGFVNSCDVITNIGWNDPTQAWDDEPINNQTNNHNGHKMSFDHFSSDVGTEDVQSFAEVHHGEYEHHYDESHHEVTVDAYTLVGKQCYALYSYVGQTVDDLTFDEQDVLTVLEATDKFWVHAQDKHDNIGYVPAAYLEIMPDHSDTSLSLENNYDTSMTHSQIAVTIAEGQQYSELNNSIQPISPSETEPHSHHHHHEHGVQYATAIYDYVATSSEEISFKAGEIIQILENFSDDGWWTGKNEAGQVGHFPSMLVHGPDDHGVDGDDDSSEGSDNSADDSSDDQFNSRTYPNFAPPNFALPKIGPSILISQKDCEEVRMLPPPPPPPIPELMNEMNGNSFPPTFAPPLKPMTLAPQTVVIIQPTPEIENKPIIDENNSRVPYDNSNGQGVSVALAIAAHEIATDITQQAIDDSMIEISRRASLETAAQEASPAQQTEDCVDISFETSLEEIPKEQENIDPVSEFDHKEKNCG